MLIMLSDLADMAAATSWMSWGLCAEADPEAFFPPDQARPGWWTNAARICDGCPVREECLAYAIDAGITVGVWGGLNIAHLQPAQELVA